MSAYSVLLTVIPTIVRDIAIVLWLLSYCTVGLQSPATATSEAAPATEFPERAHFYTNIMEQNCWNLYHFFARFVQIVQGCGPRLVSACTTWQNGSRTET
jgi:hypothetical protein